MLFYVGKEMEQLYQLIFGKNNQDFIQLDLPEDQMLVE